MGTALSDPVPKGSAPTVSERAALVRGDLGRPVVGKATLARLRVIADTLFSTKDGPPPLDRLDWLVSEMDDFLGRSGPRTRWMFAAMVLITSLLAPLFIGKLSTLSNLGRSDRVAALETLERRFGEPLLAVKAILCLIYYEHPDAAREVGFDGQCLLPAGEEPDA